MSIFMPRRRLCAFFIVFFISFCCTIIYLLVFNDNNNNNKAELNVISPSFNDKLDYNKNEPPEDEQEEEAAAVAGREMKEDLRPDPVLDDQEVSMDVAGVSLIREPEIYPDEQILDLSLEAMRDNKKDYDDDGHAENFRRWIVGAERDLVKEEMRSYSFPSSKSLKDFVVEDGGQQVRNFILSNWRSGSSFVAEILRSVPGTFYNFEPLLELEANQVQGGPEAAEPLEFLRHVINCNYKDLKHPTTQGENAFYHWILARNPRLWSLCTSNRKFCMDPSFLSSMCKLHPFQIIKTVRLRLKPAKELLIDSSLSIKLLLIVRDPRGTMLSRARLGWCHHQPACDDPKNLCSDLVNDYQMAKELTTDYPDRFMTLRYEDIVQNVYAATKKIVTFFGLEYHPQVITYLDLHTKSNSGGTYSTRRDSQSMPFKWMTELAGRNFSELEKIQSVCDEALQVWGYNKINHVNQLLLPQQEFQPMRKPPFEHMNVNIPPN